MTVRVTRSVFVEYHILNLPPSRFDQLCIPKAVSILLSYMHSVFNYNRKREVNIMSTEVLRETDRTESIVRVIVPNCGVTK